MHEAGIAERIVEAAIAAAGTRAGSVAGVEIEAGPDAPMSAEALRFHWAEAVRGTVLDGARLTIVDVAEPRALRLVALDVREA